jgi:hypothetical protein
LSGRQQRKRARREGEGKKRLTYSYMGIY